MICQIIKENLKYSISACFHFSTITLLYLFIVFGGFYTEFSKATFIFSQGIPISQKILNNNNQIKIYFENLLRKWGLFLNFSDGPEMKNESDPLVYLSSPHYGLLYFELMIFHFLFIAFCFSSLKTIWTNPGVVFYVRII